MQLHLFLSWSLNKGEWSTSRPDRYNPDQDPHVFFINSGSHGNPVKDDQSLNTADSDTLTLLLFSLR